MVSTASVAEATTGDVRPIETARAVRLSREPSLRPSRTSPSQATARCSPVTCVQSDGT